MNARLREDFASVVSVAVSPSSENVVQFPVCFETFGSSWLNTTYAFSPTAVELYVGRYQIESMATDPCDSNERRKVWVLSALPFHEHVNGPGVPVESSFAGAPSTVQLQRGISPSREGSDLPNRRNSVPNEKLSESTSNASRRCGMPIGTHH